MVPELSAGRKVEPSAGLFPQLQVDHSLLLKDTKERVNYFGVIKPRCFFPVT